MLQVAFMIFSLPLKCDRGTFGQGGFQELLEQPPMSDEHSTFILCIKSIVRANEI